MVQVFFDEDKYRRLKQTYEDAVARGLDVFTFDGQQYVTNYAKYLLEYLKQFFEPKGSGNA